MGRWTVDRHVTESGTGRAWLPGDTGPAPGWAARVLSRVRSHALDEALSRNTDPSRSPQLAARAARLTSRAMRDELARSLERLVFVAQHPRRQGLRVRRTAILLSAPALHDVATVLHGPAPVYARGVAIINELLTDGSGPPFTAAPRGGELAEVLALAHAALLDYDAT